MCELLWVFREACRQDWLLTLDLLKDRQGQTLTNPGKSVLTMSIRRRRTSGSTDKPHHQTHPLERDYVAEVQRRLAHLTQESERTPATVSEPSLPDKQRQRIEREMASLRAEALKARRLAEQIENLSRETTRLKRKSVMTESFTPSPERIEHESRRKVDTSKSGGSQLSFNPLHPSMELPPEQLIRLLGLETKKIRKGKKAHGQASDKHPRFNTQHLEIRQEPVKPAPLILPVSREHRRVRSDVHNERRGILLPAVVMGVLVGVAAAGYLFLSKPPIATIQPAVAESGSGAANSQQPAQPPDQSGKRFQPDHSPVAASPTGNPAESTQVATPPLANDMVMPVTPDRQAAIDAELARLRAEAEERFARQMSRVEASRESRELRATPIQQESAEVTLPHPPEADPTSEPETNWQTRDVSQTTQPATVSPPELSEYPIESETSLTTPPGAESPTDFPYESTGKPDGFVPGSVTAGAAMTGDVNLLESRNDEGTLAREATSEPESGEPHGRIVRQADPGTENETGSGPEFVPEEKRSELPENQPASISDTDSF